MANEDSSQSPSSFSIIEWFFQTVGRGLVYAACFWAVYAAFFQPVPSEAMGSAAAREKQQTDQARVYQDQVERSNAMYAETENQQKRMNALLLKQEEHVQRLDAVLSAWERQSGVQK
jgi:hypothetical protein